MTKATQLDAYKLFHDSSIVFSRMEQQGIRIDVEYCKKMIVHLSRQTTRLQNKAKESELYSYGKDAYGSKWNVNSDEQLAKILYHSDYYGLEPYKYTAGVCPLCKAKKNSCDLCKGEGRNISVDEEALTKGVNLPIIKDLLQIRKYEKVSNTYFSNWIREAIDGVIHPNFNLNLVISFRSSCSDPNFQNIPKRNPEIKRMCRKAIIPSPGNKLISIDVSGVEVRYGACYHKDSNMIKYIEDPTTDMHRDAAMDIYLLSQQSITDPIRHSGKNEWVFPQFYGDWYGSCAGNLWESSKSPTHILENGIPLVEHLKLKKIKNLNQFTKHLKKVERVFWEERFQGYTAWKNRYWKDYQAKGYFDFLTGFRSSGIFDKKQVYNHPIQGTAFHGTCYSMIEIDKYIIKNNLKSRLIFQIHDDIDIDTYPPEEEKLLKECVRIMTKQIREDWKWICVPIEVDISVGGIDESWYDVKKITLH